MIRSILLALLVAAATAFSPSPIVSRTVTALPVSIKIDVNEGEPIESALRRFKREVNKSGHLQELRHKRYFENGQEKKKRKVKEGHMRKRFEKMNKKRMQNRT